MLKECEVTVGAGKTTARGSSPRVAMDRGVDVDADEAN
ncbi:hypothetical protein ES705_14066 [subsurface metagenome]